MVLTIHTTPLTVRRRTSQASVGLVVLGLPSLTLSRPADRNARKTQTLRPASATPPNRQTPVSRQTSPRHPRQVEYPFHWNQAAQPKRKDISSTAPRSFAEQSPFRGRLPKTVERQIASAAAETGPWTEERLDNDRIRMRRGNTCIMVQRPRAASIDPFSEAAGRIPWRSSQPEDCTD